MEELTLCLPCSDAMDVMVQAAALIGDTPGLLPASALSELCDPCAEGFKVLLEGQTR